jgi:hypothetical protein
MIWTVMISTLLVKTLMPISRSVAMKTIWMGMETVAHVSIGNKFAIVQKIKIPFSVKGI